MTPKFSSKEIHFLKSDADDFSVTPPETFLADLLLDPSPQIHAFEKRLEKSRIPGRSFLCAVIQVASHASAAVIEKAPDTLETTFSSFLGNNRGVWESFNTTTFALAFWDYDNEKNASRLLDTLKEKIHTALKTDILMGVAVFPFHTFSRTQTFANALKAIDHAAFFGPDTLIHFDATSLNISGDRFYQMGKFDLAIQEYQKGLELKPKDINLINSLGVCYGVMGELDKARQQFESAMKINANEVMVVYNLGLLSQINSDTDKAIVYLRKAHGINDRVFEVEVLLARLLKQKNQPDAALKHLDAAAGVNPESAQVARMKGEIFLEKKHPQDAARQFNLAIKRNPSDAVSLSGYAKSLAMQNKNLNIALSFARNSLALDPENSTFKKRLAAIVDKIENSSAEEQTIKTA